MAAHARLGASSAYRWMTCPGSVRLEARLRDEYDIQDFDSPHARLGSAAHALGEHCLLKGEEPLEYLDETHPVADYADVTVDVDMVDAVSIYVDHIRSYGVPISDDTIERRVSLAAMGDWARDMFGTADFLARDRAVLLVDDYKHGQGVVVEVEDNEQFKYYGLGGLLALPLKERSEVKQIRTTVIQPRAHHEKGPVRHVTYSRKELLEWGETELKAAVLATKDPDAPLVPEAKACKFCPAKGMCPALANKAMEMAMLDFADDGTVEAAVPKDQLSAEQLVSIIDNEKFIQSWLAGVNELVTLAAQRGVDLTKGHYKLVAGRSSRSWKDEAAAEKELLSLGLARKVLFTEKFTSPAQAEKLVGAKRKGELSDLIATAEGKATLAHSSDKRPALQVDPQADFKEG